jgi:hypothetical protein
MHFRSYPVAQYEPFERITGHFEKHEKPERNPEENERRDIHRREQALIQGKPVPLGLWPGATLRLDARNFQVRSFWAVRIEVAIGRSWESH